MNTGEKYTYEEFAKGNITQMNENIIIWRENMGENEEMTAMDSV